MKASPEGFCYIRVLRGSEVVECSVLKRLELAATGMPYKKRKQKGETV